MNAIGYLWIGHVIVIAVFAFLMMSAVDEINKLRKRADLWDYEKKTHFSSCRSCSGWFLHTFEWHEIVVTPNNRYNGIEWVRDSDRKPVTLNLCAACYKKKQAEAEEKKFPPPKTSSDTKP